MQTVGGIEGCSELNVYHVYHTIQLHKPNLEHRKLVIIYELY